MYINRRVIPVETLPEMGMGEIENCGQDKFNMIYSKNFCRYHNIPPHTITMKKEKEV
jgi:hypothetical protein